MPSVHDDALCIRHWDWSETSQTVSLFTRGHGVVRALAKGAKRPKGHFSGGIELLTLAQASLILQPHAELGLLTEWDLAETFPALRRSLSAHNAGLYIADLIHHFVTDRDPHSALFDSTIAALRSLGDADAPTGPLLRFQWSLLSATGYRPRLDPVGPAADSPATFRFSPADGGLIGEGVGTAQGASSAWPVRAETIELLRRLGAAPASEPGPPQVVERANRLLAAYIRFVLGREPRTLPVVFGNDLPR